MDKWAIVEMMGHVAMAGRMGEIGAEAGLTRLDVPAEDGDNYETHYFGSAAVYGITLVTEEVALAFAAANPPARPWRGTLMARDDHERITERLWVRIRELEGPDPAELWHDDDDDDVAEEIPQEEFDALLAAEVKASGIGSIGG